MRFSNQVFWRSAMLTSGALLAASMLTGCPDKKPKTAACKTSKDCKDGAVCVASACVECASNADCDAGQVCKRNACVAECATDADCGDGKVCKVGSCKACAADADCGPGGSCDAGACKRATACKTDDECADDEDCVNGFCQKPWNAGTDTSNTCALATVLFGYDDAGISAPERTKLDGNAACIEKTKGKDVTLMGHTDTSGTEEYNIALSERRAQSVADYLARLGVDPARIGVVPKGETEPTGQGDDQDRRVESRWR